MATFLSIGKIPAPIPSFAPHGHTTWEIVQYTYGEGTATIGDQEIPFQPGTIICMPPHVPHKENSKSGYTNIYMHTDDYPGKGRVPVFTDEPHRPFFNVATMLLQEFHLKQSNSKLIAQDLFDILMLYLNRWEERSSSQPFIDQLKNTIVDNLHNPEFDIGKAVDAMPVSADHLRKMFVKATGRTPLQYMTDLRIDEAKHLLKTGGYSVKEVAVRVGIQDQYYFSRIFRKVARMSPTEFVAAAK